MAERQPSAPTHRVYTVISREGQDDYWLNLGLVFPHKDGMGFNVVLQALPLDGSSSAGKSQRTMPAPKRRSNAVAETRRAPVRVGAGDD
jgi:hypothetical protein